MIDLSQSDIDKLDNMENIFGCKLLLPPCKNKLSPFLDIRSFRDNGGDVSMVTSHLLYNKFSFFFNDDGFIEIIGSEENNGKSYTRGWDKI